MQPASLISFISTPHYLPSSIGEQKEDIRNRQDGLPLRTYFQTPLHQSPSSSLSQSTTSNHPEEPNQTHSFITQKKRKKHQQKDPKTNNIGQNPRPDHPLPRPLLIHLHKRLQHPQARLDSSLLHRPRRLPARSHHRAPDNRPAAQYPRLRLGGCVCGEHQPE